MSATSRRVLAVVALLMLGVVALDLAGVVRGGVQDAAAAAKKAPAKKAPKCIRAQIDGRRVCLRIGARCDRARRPTYLNVGLDCVRRGKRTVFVRATPAAVRQGRFVALPASGRPTFEQALAAFDRTVADLPGVKPALGSVGTVQSASTALRWLNEYRDGLTAVQRRVLDGALTPGPGAQTLTIDAAGNFTPAPPAPPGGGGLRAGPAQVTVASVTQVILEAVPRLQAKGLPFRHDITVSFAEKQVGAAAAHASPGWLRPQATQLSCHITILPRGQRSDLATLRQLMAHELTHCAQFEFLRSWDEWGNVPAWVFDGTADYAGYTISQEWNGSVAYTWYPTWLGAPGLDLFTRTYDGAGFWALIAQEGADIFSLMGPLINAGGAQAAYRVAADAVGNRHAIDWGSTMAMIAPLGPEWNLSAPGVPRPRLSIQSITNTSQPFLRYFGPRGAAVTGLDLDADIVHIRTSPSAVGRLQDAAGANHPLRPVMDFCLREGGCACPSGADSAAAQYPALVKGAAFLGIADTSFGKVSVSGESLAKQCDEDADDPDGPAGGGSGRPGIQIRSLGDQTNLGRVLATISSGTCSFGPQGFRAIGRGNGYRLELRVAGAKRPGLYTIATAREASFVTVRGPGGPYSSRQLGSNASGDPGVQPGGVQIFRLRPQGGKPRHRIGVGMLLPGPGGPQAGGIQLLPSRGGLVC